MTDAKLEPISEPGFHRMVETLYGGWALRPAFLYQKPLRSVEKSDDGTVVTITLADGRAATLTAVGDCCSRSWVEHLTVPPDLEGAVVTSMRETDVGQAGEVDGEVVKHYQTIFATTRGDVVVEYRNSSNGYYGGWLEGPREEWAREESKRVEAESRAEAIAE